MNRWMMGFGWIMVVALLTGTTTAENNTGTPASVDLIAEWDQQFETLTADIQRREHMAGFREQVFNPVALIAPSDRDPLDVVVRRTDALLRDLEARDPETDRSAYRKALDAMVAEAGTTPTDNTDGRRERFRAACALRRQIAFSNPLLDFDELLFITRHRSRFSHMCDQYYGINTPPGGSIHVLSDPFGPQPRLRDLLEGAVVESGRLKGQSLAGGSFLSPDLSYDGQTLLFAYVECEGDTEHRYHTDPSKGHWHPGRCYHLFSVNADGSNLRQLTDGTWNDFDPAWLPNGRVVFISERRGGYLRCGRVCPTYTLYDMAPDGSDINCLSPHETNEWHPSVTHDGRIIYTRWDYVDRHGCVAHQPWITTVDGRDSRGVHGNFAPRETRADMELDVRAIPASHRFVATGAPHHGQAFGSLVVFDPREEDDDAMGPARRLTPEVDFPETQGGAQVYGTPWPLSENYYLCVYDPNMKSNQGSQGRKFDRGDYGIYLLDAFGNKELIYRDPTIACLSPMPFRPRPVPRLTPENPTRAVEGAEATMAVVNVYNSLKAWPEETTIKALRIYQILPMTVPSGAPPHEIGMRLPGLEGSDSVILARYVLGTVPVEEDGSAYFTVPAKKEVFFQALDEKGLAVQSMRSATYAQPGEHLTCQGCHEPRNSAPSSLSATPLAFQRPPSVPTPDVDGTNPFSYPRLIQPILERNCLSCHEANADKAPRLDREVIAQGNNKWFASYHSLAPQYGFWQYGDRLRTTPGQFGAKASKLYPMLAQDHHGLKLSEEDLRRIALWLDSVSIFYGVYEKEGGEAQLRGEIAYPTLE